MSRLFSESECIAIVSAASKRRYVSSVAEICGGSLLDGSGAVVATGGAPIGTNAHTKPSGVSGIADCFQSGASVGLSTVQSECVKASPAITASPQKVKELVQVMGSSRESGFQSIAIVLQSSAVRARWPFMAERRAVARSVGAAASAARSGDAGAKQGIPHGNHGDNLRSVQK